MGFKFGLQKLLDMREDKEEESKRLFNDSQRKLQETQAKKEEMKSQYEKYSGINKGESLVYQKIKKNYLFALDKGLAQIDKEIEAKTKEVDFRRNDFKQKQIERKTVEILRDKQQAEYIAAENYKESVQNDEFALYAYMRNKEVG